MRAIVVLFALSVGACAPQDAGPDGGDLPEGPELPADPSECGSTCGDGPLFVIDRLEFVQPVEGVVAGFDLDGVDGDCGVPDLAAPEGTDGVDNQLSNVLSVLPATVESLLPDAIQQSIMTGNMTILTEVVGVDDMETDGPVAVVLRRGGGVPITRGDGLAAGQTFGLTPDPMLGFAPDAQLAEGVLDTAPFSLFLRFDFLGTPVAFELQRARLRMVPRGDGVWGGVVGGVVSMDDLEGVLSLLGGDDAALRDTLLAIVPNLVDARTQPDGDCDAISAALVLRAVPAFVVDEVVAVPGDTDGGYGS